MIDYKHIPIQLRNIPQWILWRSVPKEGRLPAKVPVNADRHNCNPHDPQNWLTFDTAAQMQQQLLNQNSFQVFVGFVLTAADQIFCIDLDGCRNPDTGVVATWAEEYVAFLQSYTEVSPSGTGLKIFVISTHAPYSRISVPVKEDRVSPKEPKLEIFSAKQFMAITGMPYLFTHMEERTAQLDHLVSKCPTKSGSSSTSGGSTDMGDFQDNPEADEATVTAAQRYLETVDGAVSGCGGHNATFAVACKLMIHFMLSFRQAMELMDDWNKTCQPPWSATELRHKLVGAARKPDKRGLKNIKCIAEGFQQFRAEQEAGIPATTFSTDHFNSRILQQGLSVMTIPTAPNCVVSVITSPPEWPELLPLTSTVVEEMSADDFPPVVADMIKAVAEQTETPIELPGLMALGVLATACQRKYEVCLPDGHSEPLNLWVCPAMGPGNRKTAVVTTLVKPLRDWESDRRNELKPEIGQNNSRRKSMEKRIEYLRTKAAKMDDAVSKEELFQEMQKLELELPAQRYFDCTRLVSIPQGVLCHDVSGVT